MKKSFFLLITLSLVLITSCSDDDWNQKYGKEISKVYREPNLKVTLNGKEVTAKSVMFLTSDLVTADIMLMNTIPGEDSLMFSGVKLVDTGKDNIYTFEDSTRNDDRKIAFKGQIGNGMKIDVTHEITSLAAGRWKTATFPLSVAVVANPQDSVDMKGFLNNGVIPIVKGQGTSAKQDFVGLVRGLGLTVGLVIKLEFDLRTDNSLMVSWKAPLIEQITDGQTEEGLVKYNVNNGLLYPSIALDGILASASISELMSSTGLTLDEVLILLNLGQCAYKGLPLPYNVNGTRNQNMQITITKEMLQPYMAVLVKLLIPLLEDLDMGGVNIGGITPEGLAAFVEALGVVVEKSESFELQLALTRVS